MTTSNRIYYERPQAEEISVCAERCILSGEGDWKPVEDDGEM